jgi:small conductance mechanosensitive channel
MDLYHRILHSLGDERLMANLIAGHAVLGTILVTAVLLRYFLVHGSDQLVRLTGMHWLDNVGKAATRRARSMIFWMSLLLMVLSGTAGVVYHSSGRDIRSDLSTWYSHLTGADLLRLGLMMAQLAGLTVASWLAMRLVRRLRAYLQSSALKCLATDEPQQDAPSDNEPNHEASIKRWFFLLERYSIITIGLGTLWVAGHILHLTDVADKIVGFLLRVTTILAVARLLTLACRTLSHALATWGNNNLGRGQFHRYWERVTRLFPFGERCFEAAVYVSAASLCIRELEFIAVIADFGPRIVQCIGLFFGTRVIIELLQVLLNEAFGMYQEDRPFDQKGQTLVPLLQSISQYVLYFGSGVMMLGVLGIDTRPILAGAGILGLAGGLGAQSLVTDVVSGFFILFENQYLVGDWVQIGDAAGRVEAVSIRHTQVRDEHGKLFIIPNGQIKSVINYSKSYINAVVDLKLPSGTNLESVYRSMVEAGKRLRQSRREVLGDTIIKGLVELGPTDMTVRAVTKVQPGTHLAMQYEYRRLLKEVFEQNAAAVAPKLAA